MILGLPFALQPPEEDIIKEAEELCGEKVNTCYMRFLYEKCVIGDTLCSQCDTYRYYYHSVRGK